MIQIFIELIFGGFTLELSDRDVPVKNKLVKGVYRISIFRIRPDLMENPAGISFKHFQFKSTFKALVLSMKQMLHFLKNKPWLIFCLK